MHPCAHIALLSHLHAHGALHGHGNTQEGADGVKREEKGRSAKDQSRETTHRGGAELGEHANLCSQRKQGRTGAE